MDCSVSKSNNRLLHYTWYIHPALDIDRLSLFMGWRKWSLNIKWAWYTCLAFLLSTVLPSAQCDCVTHDSLRYINILIYALKTRADYWKIIASSHWSDFVFNWWPSLYIGFSVYLHFFLHRVSKKRANFSFVLRNAHFNWNRLYVLALPGKSEVTDWAANAMITRACERSVSCKKAAPCSNLFL